ncbi:TRAP transporter small permease [Haloplanus natans]|uniref:TRAP transporter small permease n=1 Tax=Haloplanus natans TaxID=376171 RepID=UPI00067765FB|nr:TRAP transporter small permease [Haloplanus natans]
MNTTLLRKLERNFEGYIGTIMLFAYTLLIGYTIFQRETFGDPPSYTLSVTLYLFTWMTWLAAGWAIRHDSHFRFTLLRERLSNRVNYALRYLDIVAWVFFAGIVTVYLLETLQLRLESGRQILGTPIPLWTAYLAVAVGMVLIVVRSLQKAVLIRRQYKNGEDITPTSKVDI